MKTSQDIPPPGVSDGSEKSMPPKGGLGRQLVASTVANFAGQTVLMFLTFFSTPYIIHHLGDIQYGIWVLLITYVSIFTLLELGINASLVKYVAELIPKRKFDDISGYLGSALTLFLLSGTVVAVGSGLAAPWVVTKMLNIPAEYSGVAILGIRLASVGFAFQFVSQTFAAVPIASHRFDIVNSIEVGTESLRICLTMFVLYLGYSLNTIMVVTACASFLRLAAFHVAARRLLPEVAMHPRISMHHFREIFHFSKFVLVSKVSTRVVETSDKFFIGHFLPVSFVGFYAVPFALCQKLWVLAGNITTVVFPAASALSTQSDKAPLQELYIRGNKMVAGIVALPAFLLAIFSREILTYWISPEFANQGAWPLTLLSVGFLLNSLSHVPSLVSIAVGHPRISARFAVIYCVCNCGFFLLLIPKFGTIGAAVGFLATQVVQVPWYLVVVNRLLSVRMSTLFWQAFGRVLLAATLSSILSLLFRGYINSLLKLIGVFAIAGLAYLVSAYLLVLDNRERSAWWHFCAPLRFRRSEGV